MQCDNDPTQCPKCGAEHVKGAHTCPFAADVREDHDFLCTCCGDCEHECRMDV